MPMLMRQRQQSSRWKLLFILMFTLPHTQTSSLGSSKETRPKASKINRVQNAKPFSTLHLASPRGTDTLLRSRLVPSLIVARSQAQVDAPQVGWVLQKMGLYVSFETLVTWHCLACTTVRGLITCNAMQLQDLHGACLFVRRRQKLPLQRMSLRKLTGCAPTSSPPP